MYKIDEEYGNLNRKTYIDSNFEPFLTSNFTESLFLKCSNAYKIFKHRYYARHMPVPRQYQLPAPTTSTGPALADQCRTSLSSPTYASTAPVVNFLLDPAKFKAERRFHGRCIGSREGVFGFNWYA